MSETVTEEFFSDGLFIEFPILVKAAPNNGRRFVEVEASNEMCDSEGDVVLQKALLDAAPAFLTSGVLDIDHISEIGHRFNIANKADWIVGVPLEVRDAGAGRTSVVGELHQPIAGRVTKADELWNSLTCNPPVPWRASIFGYPTGKGSFVDVRNEACPEAPEATRLVIKSMNWRSLAFTRNPVNTSIQGTAQIVTMKSYTAHMQFLQKSLGVYDFGMSAGAPPPIPTPDLSMTGASLPLPRNRVELLAHHSHHIQKGQCPHCGDHLALGRSVATFRNHFMKCCGADHGAADLHALAMMHALKHGS